MEIRKKNHACYYRPKMWQNARLIKYDLDGFTTKQNLQMIYALAWQDFIAGALTTNQIQHFMVFHNFESASAMAPSIVSLIFVFLLLS